MLVFWPRWEDYPLYIFAHLKIIKLVTSFGASLVVVVVFQEVLLLLERTELERWGCDLFKLADVCLLRERGVSTTGLLHTSYNTSFSIGILLLKNTFTKKKIQYIPWVLETFPHPSLAAHFRACLHGGWGTPERWGNMWRVTPHIM